MKNAIKKISAFAMAFSILGAGAAITNISGHRSVNTIVANADAYVLLGHNFKDVKSSDWFYNAVVFAYNNNIMTGVSSSNFDPYGLLKRGQFATVIYNMAGKPYTSLYYPACKSSYVSLVDALNSIGVDSSKPNRKKIAEANGVSDYKYTEAQNMYLLDLLKQGKLRKISFKDVNEKDYFASPVTWASEHNIVSGTSSTTFSPDQNITREQMAVMLYNYTKNYKKYNTAVSSNALNNFIDSYQVSDWAKEAMRWAIANKIISGTKDINGKIILAPQSYASRAECAQVIKNYVERFGR